MGKWGDCLKNNTLKLSIHSRSRHFRSLELISEVPRSFPSLQAHFRGCLTPMGKISAQWNVLEQIPCWAWGKNSFLALKWKFLAGLGVEIPSRTIAPQWNCTRPPIWNARFWLAVAGSSSPLYKGAPSSPELSCTLNLAMWTCYFKRNKNLLCGPYNSEYT